MTPRRTDVLASLLVLVTIVSWTSPPLNPGIKQSGNVPPIASAGPDMLALPGEVIQFEATESYDPDLTGEWSRGLDLPTSRGQVQFAVLGKELYVIGGYQKTFFELFSRTFDTNEVFHAETGTWSVRTAAPTTRAIGAGVAFEGVVRIMGGISIDGEERRMLDSVEVYDPQADSWSSLDPLPRAEVVLATTLEGDIYAWYTHQQELWRQDGGTGPWTLLPRPPLDTAHARPVPLGSLLYLVGYNFSPMPGGPVLLGYDPRDELWEVKPPPAVIRCNHGAVPFRGLIVLVSGETCAGQEAFVGEGEVYDPRTDTWRLLPAIPTPRDEFATGVIDDCIVTAGGSGRDHNVQYNVTELYCAPLSFHWDFGDGSTATEERVAHSYTVPGTYAVTLTVTDPGGAEGVDTLVVTVSDNRAPLAAVDAVVGSEGLPVLLDASASVDPDGDPMMFRWDFQGDGTWDTLFTEAPTVSHVWGDDYSGIAVVEVTDGRATSEASPSVAIRNVAPLPGAPDVELKGEATLGLRVAGEKYHSVTAALYRDGISVGTTEIVRVPGTPNAQSAAVGVVDLAARYTVSVTYTPLDDPVNGQIWGATPAWLVFEQPGSVTRLSHTFNVRHPETWTWVVDDLGAQVRATEVAFAIPLDDPGSDDLVVTWEFGDGTFETDVDWNNGIGPDPFPSPDVHPRSIVAVAVHAYPSPGTYLVTVTVADDDGGSVILFLSVIL